MQSKKNEAIQYRESYDLSLYSVEGEVFSPEVFLTKNRDVLTSFEKKFVDHHISFLHEKECLIAVPLSRSARYFNGKLTVPALRGGTRSAYLKGTPYKIKGCRIEDSTFPYWETDENFNLVVEKIPFGVLSRRSVVGEILAYLFMNSLNVQPSCEPVGVFDYVSEGKSVGYGLLQKLEGDSRVESFIDCDGLSVHDLVRLKRKGALQPKEVSLSGIDEVDYLQKKTALLIRFNFNGGFRGILNSNIGNDVVKQGKLHSICDFDTFRLVEMPKRGESEKIRFFTITAFLELIKTSLPFIDYLDLGAQNNTEMHGVLSSYYKKNSSLYLSYRQLFLEQAKRLGWDVGFVLGCIEDAFLTPLSSDLLQELIPNSLTFKGYNYDFTYVPHN